MVANCSVPISSVQFADCNYAEYVCISNDCFVSSGQFSLFVISISLVLFVMVGLYIGSRFASMIELLSL